MGGSLFLTVVVVISLKEFLVPEPWDFIEPSSHGDTDLNAIFIGMGKVLHEWSRIEVSLSYLYAAFSNRPRDGAAIREYRTAGTFTLRASNICRIAQRYFVANPDQTTEAAFDRIMRMARGFADRRNEVAHGVVRKGRLFDAERTVTYTLYPPYYDHLKHDAHGMAAYRYTSENLTKLAFALVKLEDEIDLFSDPMFPDEA